MRPWCDLIKSDLHIQTNLTDIQFLALSVNEVCVSRNQTQQLTFRYVFTSNEIVDSYLDEWIASINFWERQVCYSGKIRSLPIFGYIGPYNLRCKSFLQEHTHRTMFSRYIFVNWDHESRNREGWVESVYQDVSCNYTLIDFFCVSGFRF